MTFRTFAAQPDSPSPSGERRRARTLRSRGARRASSMAHYEDASAVEARAMLRGRRMRDASTRWRFGENASRSPQRAASAGSCWSGARLIAKRRDNASRVASRGARLGGVHVFAHAPRDSPMGATRGGGERRARDWPRRASPPRARDGRGTTDRKRRTSGSSAGRPAGLRQGFRSSGLRRARS